MLRAKEELARAMSIWSASRGATSKLVEMVGELESCLTASLRYARAFARPSIALAIFSCRNNGQKLDAAGRDYLARMDAALADWDAYISDLLNYGKIGVVSFRLRGDTNPSAREIWRPIQSAPPACRIDVQAPLPPLTANASGLDAGLPRTCWATRSSVSRAQSTA